MLSSDYAILIDLFYLQQYYIHKFIKCLKYLMSSSYYGILSNSMYYPFLKYQLCLNLEKFN